MSELDSRRVAVASRLRLAREMAGLSQGQVAKMLGLHRPSISELEAGRRKVTAEELTELARIYGIDLSWLVCADADETDAERDRVELAARELAKLKSEDLDRVLALLTALRTRGNDSR
jgi:transcriptional regulator with XRE-family HTH domain